VLLSRKSVRSRPNMKTARLQSALFVLLGCLSLSSPLLAQTVTTFEGIDASQLSRPENDIDPNGAVGTMQYLEWTNVYFQAFDKVTFAPLWSSPKVGTSPWTQNGQQNCASIAGDGYVMFDRLAQRWVIGGHNSPGINGTYFYCIAVSSTDDLSAPNLKWYTYAFNLNSTLGANSNGHTYFPDWPKLGTWPDAYYVAFDLLDVDNHYQMVGAAACALDRSNMLVNASARPMQCFTDPLHPPTPGRYLSHSLIPADVEGTTAPPTGRSEFMVSIQNPPNDGVTTTSGAINLWEFSVDWATPANSTFTNTTLHVPSYTPGCYNVASVGNTWCVPEPLAGPTGGHHKIDSVGDRLMPRLAYRNFGTYESFLFSHTVRTGTNATNQQVGVRWYELRGSGVPALYQHNTIKIDTSTFRFMPSIAQDQNGNAAVGYSFSSATLHPGIRASWWNLPNPSTSTEFTLFNGTGDQGNSVTYGDYTSMTVDPVDDCTFWYVNEYFVTNQTTPLNWHTRISNFKLPGCN
jgi:hypothetical protein